MLFTEKDKKAIHDAIGAVSDSVKELAGQMPAFRAVAEVERLALAQAVTKAEARLEEGAKAHADLVQARHELLKVGNTVKEDTEQAKAKLAENTAALVAKAEEGMQRRADEISAALDKKTNRIGGMMHDLVDSAKAEVVKFVEMQLNVVIEETKKTVKETQDTVRSVQNKADSIKNFDRKLDLLDNKLNALIGRIETLEKAKTPAEAAHARK